MRIALVAPLFESVPPRLYGGTERIVSYLAEELVGMGHDVTLFASGDSRTSARLVRCCERALRLDPDVVDATPYHMIMLDQLAARAGDFDVIHFNIDLFHFPLLRFLGVSTVTTLHGRLDLADLRPFYTSFAGHPLVSISDRQRLPMPPVNWAGTVHHGLPDEHLRFTPDPSGGYLVFLGRISPEKRPDRAIEIASRAGMRLKIAAKVDAADRSYWETAIRPEVEARSGVEFIGEVGEEEKARLLGDAHALLFPIDWPEPFGLVMIEAMACGTPVIAFNSGAVPEIVDDGISGYVVQTVEEAADAVRRVRDLDRHGVRAAFEARFTARRMAEDYVAIYERLCGYGSVEPQVLGAMR